MRIAVLYGGISREREISLRSGKAVADSLVRKGHEVLLIDTRDGIVEPLKSFMPDVVFIALHGKYGEDGTVQGLLELMNIPYTGSGVFASAACMNKLATKKLLVYSKIPTPDYLLLDGHANEIDSDEWYKKIVNTLGLPVVVKAASQGSSIGTILVRTENVLLPALEEALKYDEQLVVERLIEGRECTVPILGNREVKALPVIEIASQNEFYDFQAKYNPGIGHHIIPATFDAATTEQIKETAVRAYKAMGCEGFARVDIMVDKSGKPWVLEVNTIPGMTEVSLFPDSAKAAGISFDDLIQIIVELALEKNIYRGEDAK